MTKAAEQKIRHIGPQQDRARDSLAELRGSTGLLAAITWREFRARYKQSLLGILWAVAHPVAYMVVFTLVFSKVIGVKSEGTPYPLFSYAALLPWTFFATGTTLAMNSLLKNLDLVTKVWFPREVLPLGSITASLVDFSIALGIYGFMLLGYQMLPGWTVLMLPLLIGLQIMLTAGVSFFVAALNVRFRDIKFITPLGIQLWLYASPVIYSIDAVPEKYRLWYALNPMVGLIDGYRAAVLHNALPNFTYLGMSALGCTLVLLAGWWYFHRVEIYFADVI